jgi:hypothetical protein
MFKTNEAVYSGSAIEHRQCVVLVLNGYIPSFFFFFQVTNAFHSLGYNGCNSTIKFSKTTIEVIK